MNIAGGLYLRSPFVVFAQSINKDVVRRWTMPKYTRNSGKEWTSADSRELIKLAGDNTPTRVIGLKLGRTEAAVRTQASAEKVSLKPTNQSPYNRKH